MQSLQYHTIEYLFVCFKIHNNSDTCVYCHHAFEENGADKISSLVDTMKDNQDTYDHNEKVA